MAGFLGGSSSKSRVNTPAQIYSSLQVQTSLAGKPIPIVYGQIRISGNLIWYGQFQAIPHSSGGGKSGGKGGGGGGGGGNVSYTYQASVAIALCEGPIIAVPRLWDDKTLSASEPFTIFTGSYSQTPWGYLATLTAPVAEQHTIPATGPYTVTVAYTSPFIADGGVVGASGAPFTVVGSAPAVNQYAVNASTGTYSFNAANAGETVTISYTAGNQQPPNAALNYRGLAYGGAAALQLGNSAELPNFGFEIQSPLALTSISGDGDPSAIIADYLTNPYYGVGFPTANLGSLSTYSSYCWAAGLLVSDALISQQAANDYLKSLTEATNSEFVWSSGALTIVPYGDAGAVSGNGHSFTPAATPQFTFTDDDYLANQSGGSSGVSVTDKGGKYDPVLVNRTRPSDAYNAIKVEYLDRTNAYNPGIVEWKDDAAITAFGLRAQDTKTYHFFCLATAANQAAVLQGARQQVRNTYTFTVGLKYCQLDPMDLVALNDAALGLVNHLVLIKEITESYDKELGQCLTIVAEDYLNAGSGAALPYGHQPNSGYVPNYNQDPGNANAPIVISVPVQIAGNGGLEVWMAVSGSGPTWAGAQIWISSDGSTYKQAGIVQGPARQGVLTAPLSLGMDPDTTDTLSVSLAESGGSLLSGTKADADSFATLCCVDGELVSYETATLTGPNAYDLTYLRRGAYGTIISAHASGAPFARLDNSIFAYPYSRDQIGQTIYVKLLSFNLWGGALQTLSEVSATSFTLQGPPLPGQVQGLAAQQNGDTVLITWIDLADFAIKGYDILYGVAGGTISSAKLISEASRATSESTVSIPPGTWTIYLQGHDIADQLGPPAAVNLTVTNANIPVISAAAAPDWLGAKSGFILHYTGVLLPDSTKLASNLTNAQLFTGFAPFPVASPTYTTPVQDAGFNDELRVFFTDAAAPGPGVGGSTSVSFSLDSWADGASDPNSYAAWPAAANVDARYYKGRLTQSTAVPSVVAQFTLIGDVAAASLQTVQGFAVGSGGTTLSFAAAGVGPFHSAPAITVSPADGVLTSAGASSITASSAFIQGFIGSALAAGTVNIFISGS